MRQNIAKYRKNCAKMRKIEPRPPQRRASKGSKRKQKKTTASMSKQKQNEHTPAGVQVQNQFRVNGTDFELVLKRSSTKREQENKRKQENARESTRKQEKARESKRKQAKARSSKSNDIEYKFRWSCF